ncbi:MAG: hypothetical protein PHF60_05215 [Candidatus ainarchaeum sp.]|nr:hypothetical protein [Candidatus ainarchaeum sp.]
MKRSTSAGLIVAGTILAAAVGYSHATKYSPERVWERQRPAIERAYYHDAKAKDKAYTDLKDMISMWDGEVSAPREQRCKDELRFTAVTLAKGNEEKADEALAKRSYEPYAECKPQAEFMQTAGRWYSIAAAGAVLLGLLGMLRGRKEYERGY